MSYADSGFDSFFTREYRPAYTYTAESSDSAFEDGSINFSKLIVKQLSAVTSQTGTLTVDETVTVGDDNIILDGPNIRIVVNDGSYDRVYLGQL